VLAVQPVQPDIQVEALGRQLAVLIEASVPDVA